MKVREILSLAAANLGREDLVRAIDDALLPAGETEDLLRCYNLVENEIALDYFPLRTAENLLPEEGRISYSDFSYAPVSVTEVRRRGTPVPFELFPSEMKVAGEGEVCVSYSYSPAKKSLQDESSFSGRISARLLSFGVACEFCLSHALFPEAALWEKKYREALRAAELPRKKLSMRSRRWV